MSGFQAMAIGTKDTQILKSVVVSISVYVVKFNWYSSVRTHLSPTTLFAFRFFQAYFKKALF